MGDLPPPSRWMALEAGIAARGVCPCLTPFSSVTEVEPNDDDDDVG